MALDLGELNAVIDADDRGFNRTIDRTRKKMDAVGKKMGGLTGMLKVLGASTAFGALATGAAGAASSLGPLVGLVGSLAAAAGGLAAAAPAFAAGAAVAVGTLTIAFRGLGDAISGDEEALERLAPAAREVVETLEDLKPAWRDVTRSIQQRMFADLADDLGDVAGRWMPLLERGLGDVAGGFNDVARHALKALRHTSVIEGFNEVTEHTADGLRAFAKGVGPWMEGIAELIAEFAPLLTDAGEAAADLGERFRDWVAQARETGRLADLIETMKDTLSTLGGILSNLGSVFSSVFSAANETGGGLLNTIEDVTGRLAEFFRSADGEDALNSFFTALAEVADAVIPIVIELAEAFAEDLAPHFAEIARELGPTLRDLVRELGDAIGNVDIANLASGLAEVLDAVIPLIGPLGEFIGWISQIDGLVPIVVAALVGWTVAQWALNIAMYANPITWVIGLIMLLIAAVALIIINWETVSDFLSFTWAKIRMDAETVWTAIADFFVGLWNGIVDFFVGVWDSIVSGFETGVAAALATVDWFKSIPGNVAEWFGGAKDAAIGKLNELVDWLGGIPGMITGAIGDLGSLLWDAGQDVIQGLLDGIDSMIGAVQDKLSGLTNMLPDWKGPAEVDRKILAPAGEMVIGGFVDGLERAIPSVQRALSGLTGELGLMVDGDAAPAANELRVNATTHLSDEDRELLRELADVRARLDIRTDGRSRIEEQRDNSLVVT